MVLALGARVATVLGGRRVVSREDCLKALMGGRRVQYCLNPNSSEHFLYFRAIQAHSGGNLVDPALQENVLLPEDFTSTFITSGM